MEKIIDNVQFIIDKYSLLDNGETAYVGLSGGKDSVVACFILRDMGYNVIPIIVDVGDAGFDATKIKYNIDKSGFDAKIISIYDNDFINVFSENEKKDIQNKLNYLLDVPDNQSACTTCYNLKLTAFQQFFSKSDNGKIVIAQHKDDMITSMMKCYWTHKYYHNITKINSISYDGYLMKEYISKNKLDINLLSKLVKEGLAATDDPIREFPLDNLEIIRPLARVDEETLQKYVDDISYDVINGDNSCRYRRKEPRPFRLLVQWDLEKRLKDNPALKNTLYDYVIKGLDKRGMLKFRPRNLREVLYPGFKKFIKKY